MRPLARTLTVKNLLLRNLVLTRQSARPSLLRREQLGLELAPEVGPVDVRVIDRVDKP